MQPQRDGYFFTAIIVPHDGEVTDRPRNARGPWSHPRVLLFAALGIAFLGSVLYVSTSGQNPCVPRHARLVSRAGRSFFFPRQPCAQVRITARKNGLPETAAADTSAAASLTAPARLYSTPPPAAHKVARDAATTSAAPTTTTAATTQRTTFAAQAAVVTPRRWPETITVVSKYSRRRDALAAQHASGIKRYGASMRPVRP